MPEEISLDEVNISPAAYEAWQEIVERIDEILPSLEIAPSDIPNEKTRIENDGSLTIFVTLPIGEVSLRVPPHQWTYRFPKN